MTTLTSAASSRPPVWRRHPPTVVVDALLVIGAAAFGIADLAFDFGANGSEATLPAVLAVLAGATALAVRRSWPLAVVALISLLRIAVADVGQTEIALSIPAIVALFTAARTLRRPLLPIAVVVSLVAGVLSLVVVGPTAMVEETAGEVVLILLVLVTAELLRVNESRVAQRVEIEAATRVHHERQRIARDLHDVVAHSLSNITVQAGVAARLLRRDPDHAERALEIINEAGRESLDELRAFLGLLRADVDISSTHPTPGTDQDLATLFDRAIEAGLQLTVNTRGAPTVAPSSTVTVALYRIIQESLTNVTRHAGPVAVSIDISYEPEQIGVTITNSPGAGDREPVPSTGVGIVGMTERAEAMGGWLTTSRHADGTFEVAASLPYGRHVDGGRP
ncbi:MAG: histidine kinase [Actinomycetota bacterium]